MILSNLKSLCKIVVACGSGKFNLKKFINLSNLALIFLLSVDFFHLISHPSSCLFTKPSGLPKLPKPTSSESTLCRSAKTSIIRKLNFLMFSLD